MKKLLLTFVVAMFATTAINAQVLGTTTWSKTLFTVASPDDITDGELAVDAAGNLYVSGALTQTTTFGSYTLEPIGVASYILCYDATGNVKWATAIQGSSTVTSMDIDAAGSLYVAGQFADEILVCEATSDENVSLISSNADNQVATFLLKYSAEGELLLSQACEAVVDATVNDSYMYFGNPASIVIEKIQVEGETLYVGFSYNGDVTFGGYTLEAKYVFNAMGVGDYFDTTSAAVLALNSSTFAPTALLANISVTEDNKALQGEVYDINFTVDNGDVYVAAQGYGDITIQTPNGSKDFEFTMDGAGSNEYGMIVAKIGSTETVKVYNNIQSAFGATYYNAIDAIKVVGDDLYMVGSFRGYCALDNTLSTLDGETEVSTSDIFAASLSTDDLTTNWVVKTPDQSDVVNQEYEDVVGAMIYPNEIRLISDVKKVNDDTYVTGSNKVISAEGVVSSLNNERATAVANNGGDAAYVLNMMTLTAVYYGTVPAEEEEEGEDIEVINGEILKANVWNSTITAVDAADDVNADSPVAMDAEGNVYVSGSQNSDFDFAETTISSLGIGAYVAKYDVAGNEKYAFAMYGAVEITAMTTDAEGNLYVAANFAEEAYVTDVEGISGEYETVTGAEGDWSMECPSSFLAKYDANGNLLSVQTYTAVSGAASDLEYWGNMAYVSVNKLVAEGEKVYAQFEYNGDLTIGSLSLEAKYINYAFFAYMDSPSFAVVAFDSEMANATKVSDISMATDGDSVTSMIETANFAVDGEDVYVSFVGYGNLAVTTAQGTDTFSFSTDGDTGATEHAVVVTKISASGDESLEFENTPHTSYNVFNEIVGMDVYAGNLYIAGTFNETCPFDNSAVAVGAADIFVVSIDTKNLDMNWLSIDAKDEGATNVYYEEVSGMAIYKGNVYVTGAVVNMNDDSVAETINYNVNAEGSLSAGEERLAYAVAYNDDYATLVNMAGIVTNIACYSFEELTGIEEVVISESSNIAYQNGTYFFAEPVDAQIYDIQGRCVKVVKAATEISTEGMNKGVYILKAGTEVVKFIK